MNIILSFSQRFTHYLLKEVIYLKFKYYPQCFETLSYTKFPHLVGSTSGLSILVHYLSIHALVSHCFN